MAGYRVCGKTGTSEKVDKWNEDRTQDMEYIASLLRLRPGGGAPNTPCWCSLMSPMTTPTAATTAATPWPALLRQDDGGAAPYLGVEAQYNEEEYANLDTMAPTVTGMTLEQAHAELEEAGLSYSVVGG